MRFERSGCLSLSDPCPCLSVNGFSTTFDLSRSSMKSRLVLEGVASKQLQTHPWASSRKTNPLYARQASETSAVRSRHKNHPRTTYGNFNGEVGIIEEKCEGPMHLLGRTPTRRYAWFLGTSAGSIRASTALRQPSRGLRELASRAPFSPTRPWPWASRSRKPALRPNGATRIGTPRTRPFPGPCNATERLP